MNEDIEKDSDNNNKKKLYCSMKLKMYLQSSNNSTHFSFFEMTKALFTPLTICQLKYTSCGTFINIYDCLYLTD